MMKGYRPSSELQRMTEEAERNIRRRTEWAHRVFRHEGRWPSLLPSGLWSRVLQLRQARARMLRAEHHGNSNVIPFPRHRRQYMHTRLPEPPEVA